MPENPDKPDFQWIFNRVSRGRTTVFGAGIGGGSHVEIWYDGIKEHNVIHFEESFRGGVQVTVLPDNDVLVGAGFGGSPRWQRWNRKHPGKPMNEVWKEMSNQFLGGSFGADLRDGCQFLEDGRPKYGYVPINATYPVQPFVATPRQGIAGDTLGINAELYLIPIPLQQRCVNEGAVLYAYNGKAITDIPEYSYLKGKPTPMHSDGARTWDQVSAAHFGTEALTNGKSVLHEMGHAIMAFVLVTTEAVSEFDYLWRDNYYQWTTSYERDNMNEAAAECVRRQIERPESNNHLRGVQEFMTKYIPESIK